MATSKGHRNKSAEIATSIAAIDLGSKRNVYRRNGVQEYLVWQTFENRFSWFRLQAEEFVLIEPDADGMIRSSVFPFFVAGGVGIIGGQHDVRAECAASRDWRSETSGVCSGVGRAIIS